jgi:predicted kinase
MIKILVGLPGSGKSTLAKRLVDEHLTTPYTQAAIVSADDFFTDEDGTYHYIPTAIGQAHTLCYDRFQEFAKRFRNKDLIVVDNTHLTEGERRPYITAAEALGHDVQVVYIPCDLETSLARNVHHVPVEIIEEMVSKLDVPSNAQTVSL